MQQPIFFENEIVQPKNLSFFNDSTAKNIKDIVLVVGGGNPGKLGGLSLSGVSGNNFFVVSPGVGFAGDGERIQIYSTGINFNITFTGTQNIYLNYAAAVWNPDPTINPLGAAYVVTNVDPTDDSLVAVENYNIAEITITSGSNYINLGAVTADSSMLYLTASPSGSQDFTIGGIIDINTSTINGLNISSGSIDSNIFTPELHYNITLSTGVNFNASSSGTSNIASLSRPFSNIYALTGNFHQLVGFSPILIDSMKQISGTSLEATGTNLVQIDTQSQGTRFGNGLILNTNSISTAGSNNDVNIFTDPLQRLNINTTTNIAAGSDLFIKDNLFVSGIANFGTTNIASITGNLNVVGSLSYGSTIQRYDNLVPNSDFSINNLGVTGIGLSPASWSILTLNSDFAYGPVTIGNPSQYLSIPSALNTQISNNLAITGNYTVEMNVNVFGPTLYTAQPNTLFFKSHSTNSNFSNTLQINTSSGLSFTSNGSSQLASPTGSIHNNQWYSVAYTWNGLQRKIYIDGVLAGTDSIDGSWHIGNAFMNIGGYVANQGLINGLINNFRISNIAITSFPSGSAAPLPISANNVLGYWKLNQTLNDVSITGNTLISAAITPVPYTDTRLGQVFSGTTNIASNDLLPTGSQSSLFGTPHTNTWLLCSGVNIDSTGIFMAAPTNLKPNTTYNISYYAKHINGNSSNLGIINYVYGTTTSGTYVQSIGTPINPISSTEWTRFSSIATTPTSGSNFNFGLAIRNNQSSGTVNSIFGLTAIQATEGPALISYGDNVKKKILNIPLSLFKANFGNGAGLQPVYSANINTNGGLAIVSAPLNIGMARYSSPNGIDQQYYLSLWIDGSQVAVADTVIPYAIVNSMPISVVGGFANYEWTGNGNLQYMGYLSPGNHLVEIKLNVGGGGSSGVINTYYIHGDITPLQIMLLE